MGEYIHTKFWIGGDVSRPIAKRLLKAVADEEMCLADDSYDEEQYAPQTVNELVKNRVGGTVALFDYCKNYGDCPVLEAFCTEHGIPWDKWHTAGGGGEWGPNFYYWRPGMGEPLILSCTDDQELLIPKAPIDEVIKLFEAVVANKPVSGKDWKAQIFRKLALACPQEPELPPFRIINDDGESEEDVQLAKAIELLEEAASTVSAADVQARDAILNLAKGLEPKEEEE